MMKRTLKFLKTSWILMGLVGFSGAAEPVVRPYETKTFQVDESRIDHFVFDALRKVGIKPAMPCSDEVFVRRVYLDAIGILPESSEVEAFLRDAKPGKRARSDRRPCWPAMRTPTTGR